MSAVDAATTPSAVTNPDRRFRLAATRMSVPPTVVTGLRSSAQGLF
ncbi:MAG: hypothetical protein R8G01_22160 [Ilumatobacteraceae bacterium]|nr:hypothetical protein [Ilumatobacteraceae bacterium]